MSKTPQAQPSVDGKPRITARITVRIDLDQLTEAAIDVYLDGGGDWDDLTAKKIADEAKDNVLYHAVEYDPEDYRSWPQWDRLDRPDKRSLLRRMIRRHVGGLFGFPEFEVENKTLYL